MGEGDTAINAVLGAAVTVLLSGVVPFSPVLGGAIAGYLQGGDRSAGVRIGTMAGVLAFIPAVLLGVLVLALLSTLLLGGTVHATPFALFGFGGVLFVFAALAALVYVVGLSALGGWLGNYVRHDTDYDL